MYIELRLLKDTLNASAYKAACFFSRYQMLILRNVSEIVLVYIFWYTLKLERGGFNTQWLQLSQVLVWVQAEIKLISCNPVCGLLYLILLAIKGSWNLTFWLILFNITAEISLNLSKVDTVVIRILKKSTIEDLFI